LIVAARYESTPFEEHDMDTRLKTLIVAASVAVLSPLAVASAQDSTKAMMMAGVTVKTTSLGPTLVDAKSMTLYTWGNDTLPGKSACNGQCATNWPPLTAAGDAKPMGDWTVVARDDGTKQWAYKGKPLYTYRTDAKEGDVTGNGRGKWAAAKP
jgi:predicted lipoprotein with Yx(FWY)xxD motif